MVDSIVRDIDKERANLSNSVVLIFPGFSNIEQFYYSKIRVDFKGSIDNIRDRSGKMTLDGNKAWDIYFRLRDCVTSGSLDKNTSDLPAKKQGEYIHTMIALVKTCALKKGNGFGYALIDTFNIGEIKDRKNFDREFIEFMVMMLHCSQTGVDRNIKDLLKNDQRIWMGLDKVPIGLDKTPGYIAIIYVIRCIWYDGEYKPDSESFKIKKLAESFNDIKRSTNVQWPNITLDFSKSVQSKSEDVGDMITKVNKIPDIFLHTMFYCALSTLSPIIEARKKTDFKYVIGKNIIPDAIMKNLIPPAIGSKCTESSRNKMILLFNKLLSGSEFKSEYMKTIRDLITTMDGFFVSNYDPFNYGWIINNAFLCLLRKLNSVFDKVNGIEQDVMAVHNLISEYDDDLTEMIDRVNVIVKSYAKLTQKFLWEPNKAAPFIGEIDYLSKIHVGYKPSGEISSDKYGILEKKVKEYPLNEDNIPILKGILSSLFPKNVGHSISVCKDYDELMFINRDVDFITTDRNIIITGSKENQGTIRVLILENHLFDRKGTSSLISITINGEPDSPREIEGLKTGLNSAMIGLDLTEENIKTHKILDFGVFNLKGTLDTYPLIYAIWIIECFLAGFDYVKIMQFPAIIGDNFIKFIIRDYPNGFMNFIKVTNK